MVYILQSVREGARQLLAHVQRTETWILEYLSILLATKKGEDRYNSKVACYKMHPSCGAWRKLIVLYSDFGVLSCAVGFDSKVPILSPVLAGNKKWSALLEKFDR